MSTKANEAMYELPLSRLHSLADAERQRDQYREALETIADAHQWLSLGKSPGTIAREVLSHAIDEKQNPEEGR